MKLGQLKKFDESFTLVDSENSNESEQLIVEGITDKSEFLPRHLFFIKNKNFLNLFLESEDALSIGVVVEKKFFDGLSPEQLEALKIKAYWLATTTDVSLSMSFFSKPFYEEKFQNINDMVDGRQMGTSTIHPTAWIAQGVFVGENVGISANVKIHPGVVLMSGVHIGEGSEIYPNTTLYRNVKIGNNVRIHAHCSIGADGFGYNFSKGVHHKVWHMGSVIVGDDVEIGANSCIDSGSFSPTIIGPGTKMDNLVQVGHNCKLGVGVILCGQVAIGGSTNIGDFTVFGGQAGAANGLEIGKCVQVAGASGATNNIEDGAAVGGFPARNIKEWIKGMALVRKLSLEKN